MAINKASLSYPLNMNSQIDFAYNLYSSALDSSNIGGSFNSEVLGNKFERATITLGPNTSFNFSVLFANFLVMAKKPSGNSEIFIKAYYTSLIMKSSNY
mmetsp:Transcript_2806/g.259  ORF Transcript_2806/g.259 Transcript_2806/m.259 type:complete len:99 (-) Transcript_2806:124-420(-)